MRQTWARMRSGVRGRVLDGWWQIREGSRAGQHRLLLGPLLVVGLMVVVAADVALLLQATRSEPGSRAPVPAPTVTLTGEETAAFVNDHVVEPEVRGTTVTGDGDRQERDSGDRTRDEGGRGEREKGAAASQASTPTPSSEASPGASSDSSTGSSDKPPAEPSPAASDEPDPGTGPGGGGTGGTDGGGGGTDGGGGGGGGG